MKKDESMKNFNTEIRKEKIMELINESSSSFMVDENIVGNDANFPPTRMMYASPVNQLRSGGETPTNFLLHP